MFRSIALLSLFACSPLTAERATLEANPGDLDRADLLGSTIEVGATLALGREAATNDTHLFLQVEGGDCGRIAIFSKEDLDHGLRDPSEWLDCPAHLPHASTYRFFRSLEVRDDLLAAGPYLYRRTGSGWIFEAELGAPTLADESLLLGEDQAVTIHDGNLYIHQRIDGRWRNVQRIEASWNALLYRASGDLMMVKSDDRWSILGRDEDGVWDWTWEHEAWFLHGGRVLDADGSVSEWDGNELVDAGVSLDLPTYRSHRGRELFHGVLFDERITLLTSEATRVFDLDGVLIALDDEQPIRGDWLSGAYGAVSFARRNSRSFAWTHLDEPVIQPLEPDSSFTQTHEMVLTAGDEVVFAFDVNEDIETIDIQMDGTGDADLVVEFEPSNPVDERYAAGLWQYDHDCAPYAIGSEELCQFPAPAPVFGRGLWHTAGTFQVRVVGFAPLSEVNVTVEAFDVGDEPR